MKKLYIIFLALAIALVMTVPLAIPVAADSPTVLGRITGAGYETGPDGKPWASFGGGVILLSDGTVIGEWHGHIFKNNPLTDIPGMEFLKDTVWVSIELVSLSFPDDNTAVLTVEMMCVNNKVLSGYTEVGTFVIIDSGEPGGHNDSFDKLYDLLPPVNIMHGNYQVWVSDEYVP